MAELDDLFHMDQYAAPERLTELCYKAICKNLDTISVKGRDGHRVLKKGITFPSEICDNLILHYAKYVQQCETNEDEDCFLSIFKNLAATRLKRVKISNWMLTDESVLTLASHKLYELELSECDNLTEACIEHINANSENLHSLAFHGAVLIIPTRLSASKHLPLASDINV